ncbi:hypothetical protein L1987_29962 [Smallanthus sonchifolius]|uniref:Uncharacterized protein n=1 Tax=Smallanthus sonchifolius TaxID=185202 RepID=A0ACB9I3A0_9ASTR|nr:hypothetical protein L1987_29962 [Smallanthus sonchifolius]
MAEDVKDRRSSDPRVLIKGFKCCRSNDLGFRQTDSTSVEQIEVEFFFVYDLGKTGWTPAQCGHSHFKYFNASSDDNLNKKLTGFLHSILKYEAQFHQSNVLTEILIYCPASSTVAQFF